MEHDCFLLTLGLDITILLPDALFICLSGRRENRGDHGIRIHPKMDFVSSI